MLSKQIKEFDRMQEGNCFGKYAKFNGRVGFQISDSFW